MIYNYKKPEPTLLTKAEIQKIAEEYHYSSGFSIDANLIQFVKRIGGWVHLMHLDYKIKESLVVKDGSFDVFLPDCLDAARLKRSLAHEIGHYVLHSDCGAKNIIAEPYGTDGTESEANWFASAFLLPKDKFIEIHNKHKDIGKICSLYDLSYDLVERRIKEVL